MDINANWHDFLSEIQFLWCLRPFGLYDEGILWFVDRQTWNLKHHKFNHNKNVINVCKINNKDHVSIHISGSLMEIIWVFAWCYLKICFLKLMFICDTDMNYHHPFFIVRPATAFLLLFLVFPGIYNSAMKNISCGVCWFLISHKGLISLWEAEPSCQMKTYKQATCEIML